MWSRLRNRVRRARHRRSRGAGTSVLRVRLGAGRRARPEGDRDAPDVGRRSPRSRTASAACSSIARAPIPARSSAARRTSHPCTTGCAAAPVRGRGRRRGRRTPGRARSALQGEGEPQAPGRCRLRAAPGRAGLPDDRHPRVGDDRGRACDRGNGAPKSCRPASARCSRSTTGAASSRQWLHGWRGGLSRCARGRRCGSTAGRHTGAGRTARRARRALYPTYNAARGGPARRVLRASAAFGSAAPGDRARVSLIGDFEGRSVEGGVHGARRLPLRHVGPSHTPNLAALAALGGRAPHGARAVMTSRIRTPRPS